MTREGRDVLPCTGQTVSYRTQEATKESLTPHHRRVGSIKVGSFTKIYPVRGQPLIGIFRTRHLAHNP